MRLLYDRCTDASHGTENSQIPKPYKVKTVANQGCVAAPTLFSVSLTAALCIPIGNVSASVQIYRMERSLSNLDRL